MAGRTFSKEIRQANIKHAINCYRGKGGKTAFIKEYRSFLKENHGVPELAIRDMANKGSFLVTYYDQRQYIKKLLKETKEESERYDDWQVFDLYKRLLVRDVRTMPELKDIH